LPGVWRKADSDKAIPLFEDPVNPAVTGKALSASIAPIGFVGKFQRHDFSTHART